MSTEKTSTAKETSERVAIPHDASDARKDPTKSVDPSLPPLGARFSGADSHSGDREFADELIQFVGDAEMRAEHRRRFPELYDFVEKNPEVVKTYPVTCVECDQPATGNIGTDWYCDACGTKRSTYEVTLEHPGDPQCCFVTKRGDRCEQSARFWVGGGGTPDPYDFTESCGDHVEDLRADGDSVVRLSDGKVIS